MEKDDEDRATLSRRELLKRVGIVGAAAMVPPEAHALAASSQARNAAPVREALETFTVAEAATVDAIAARLIPSDDNGPGAREARAAHYIDRALGGALSSSLDAYRSGLGAVDRYAQASRGAPFAALSPSDQDAVLRDMESNAATGFSPDAATFFTLVRTHTLQGTFSDPYYGGNANFVGWDMVGYPGVRVAVTENDQRMDAHPATIHKSAYDYAMFSKRRPARASLTPKDDHGD